MLLKDCTSQTKSLCRLKKSMQNVNVAGSNKKGLPLSRISVGTFFFLQTANSSNVYANASPHPAAYLSFHFIFSLTNFFNENLKFAV